MRTLYRLHAILLLAVFLTGALLLPLAHEFTHVRSLEHEHGDAAAHAGEAHERDALDFLVEERTVPHNPNCDLCARLALDTPVAPDDVSAPPIEDARFGTAETQHLSRAHTSRQIRAPPGRS